MEYLFKLFFSTLNESGIFYAITGRTEDYPGNIQSDIDIILPLDQIESFWRFMIGLQQQKIEWIQIISHEITGHYCIVILSNGKKINLLKPDVCSDYYRNGVLFLKADYLLKDRIFNPKGFYQLAPEKEFIYYLLKKIDKENIDKEQFNHLLNQWNVNKRGCLEVISLFFINEHQQFIREAFNNNEVLHLINNIDLLKKGLHYKLKFSTKDFLLKVKNRINRIIHPTGLVISFMGPDGCGKTTIINGVKLDLTDAFRKNKQFHFFPKEIINAPITIDPHAKKAHGFVFSIIKLFYYLALYNFGFLSKVYPSKIKSTFIIFDRFYHDLLIDPYRYRHGTSLLWIKLASYLIPKPDLWILLDASAEVIQQRKSEVPIEETLRQVNAYRNLFCKLDNAFIINANQTPDRVIYDTEKVIITYLSNRTKKRCNIKLK